MHQSQLAPGDTTSASLEQSIRVPEAQECSRRSCLPGTVRMAKSKQQESRLASHLPWKSPHCSMTRKWDQNIYSVRRLSDLLFRRHCKPSNLSEGYPKGICSVLPCLVQPTAQQTGGHSQVQFFSLVLYHHHIQQPLR